MGLMLAGDLLPSSWKVVGAQCVRQGVNVCVEYVLGSCCLPKGGFPVRTLWKEGSTYFHEQDHVFISVFFDITVLKLFVVTFIRNPNSHTLYFLHCFAFSTIPGGMNLTCCHMFT